jgi:formylglycine-generating enzyme required for sulfatase activity
MGAPRGDLGAGRYNNIQVEVTLTRPFSMGQTEVTNEQWLAMGFNSPERERVVVEGLCREPECPVGNVKFFDMLRYANSLSEKEGYAPCYELGECTGTIGRTFTCNSVFLTADTPYQCEGYRLPMEAEWEYATRAGTTTTFHGGDATGTVSYECDFEPGLVDVGWYCHNSDMRSHPVAQKEPNAWGLHDLHGNLFELCNDYFDGLGYGEGPLVDPPGTQATGRDLYPPELPNGIDGHLNFRIARGGSYNLPADSAAAAQRIGAPNDDTSEVLGFRLARTLLQ